MRACVFDVLPFLLVGLHGTKGTAFWSIIKARMSDFSVPTTDTTLSRIAQGNPFPPDIASKWLTMLACACMVPLISSGNCDGILNCG